MGKVRFYRAKRDVPGLFEEGDKFALLPEGQLFLVNAPATAAYLSADILAKYGGLDKYFESCEPVRVPAVAEWLRDAEEVLRQLEGQRGVIEAEMEKCRKLIADCKALEGAADAEEKPFVVTAIGQGRGT